jgi:hypothetical protein
MDGRVKPGHDGVVNFLCVPQRFLRALRVKSLFFNAKPPRTLRSAKENRQKSSSPAMTVF